MAHGQVKTQAEADAMQIRSQGAALFARIAETWPNRCWILSQGPLSKKTPTVLKAPTTKMDPAVVLATSVVKVVVKTPAEVVQVSVTPHYNNVSFSQVPVLKETTSTHQTSMIVTTSQERSWYQ